MNNRKKLITAALGLLLSVVVITTASVAWYTVSTNPEVGGISVTFKAGRSLLVSDDAIDWSSSIDVSSAFAGMDALHPVSTVDGINWYLPTYNATTGSINNVDEFILDDELKYANVLESSSGTGYYVYTDIWLKTEEDTGCTVNLSIPQSFVSGGNSQSGMHDEELAEGVYGSYVLDYCTYDYSTNTIKDSGYGVQNTIRVGFLINPTTYKSSSGLIEPDSDFNSHYAGNEYDESDSGQAKDKFFIYEPNADSRTAYEGTSAYSEGSFSKPSESGSYISGFELEGSTYGSGSGQYFVTEPVGYDASNSGKGKLANSNSGRLIVQTTSYWDNSKVATALTTGRALGSNQVKTMGSFISNVTDAYTTMESVSGRSFSLASEEKQIGSQTLIRLDKDQPVKVRIFIWIEGQDVDCWNDVSGVKFIVNLELAAQVIE